MVAFGKIASNSGSRSAVTQSLTDRRASFVLRRAARRSPINISSSGPHDSPARPSRPSSSVRQPKLSSASCSSSASRTSGHASSRTRAIAAASSAAMSSADVGSSERRVYTAWVRRSSSGTSSRKAYGRAFSTSWASGDGSRVSRATQRIDPSRIRRKTSSSPSMFIASIRQSSTVWLTSGWSGTSRSPTMFSRQAT